MDVLFGGVTLRRFLFLKIRGLGDWTLFYMVVHVSGKHSKIYMQLCIILVHHSRCSNLDTSHLLPCSAFSHVEDNEGRQGRGNI